MLARCVFDPCQTSVVGSEVERELGDRWWLGLRGSTVESVAVNEYTVILALSSGSTLTIEGQAELAQDDQAAVSLNDDEAVTAFDMLRSLPGARVVSQRGLQDRRSAPRLRYRRQAAYSFRCPLRSVATDRPVGTDVGFPTGWWPRAVSSRTELRC